MARDLISSLKEDPKMQPEDERFKMYLYNEFYLRFPFYQKKLLKEDHGYIKSNIIVTPILLDIENKGFPYSLTDMSLFKIKPFFDLIDLKIDATRNPNIKGITKKGQYIGEDSGFVNGKYKVTIYISLICNKVKTKDILDNLKTILSHEFLHAYDDYNERLNGRSIKSKSLKNGYFSLKLSHHNNIFRKYAFLTNVLERNAYLGQLKAELESFTPYFSNIESVWKCLRKTESYANYLYLKDFVESLPLVDIDHQKRYIDDYNEIYQTTITAFSSIVNRCQKRWWKYSKKYLTTACKIVADVFNENMYNLVELY